MTGRRRWATSVAALAALGLAGCGSRPAISKSAAAILANQVSAIHGAAMQQDWATARALLAQLRASAASLQASGQIASARESAILASAAAVEAQLPAASPSPAAPPAVAPSPPPQDTPPRHGRGKDNGD